MKTHLRIAKTLTNLLEHNFKIFGFEIGIDPIIGLIFGAGDFFTLIVGGYYIWIATQTQVPPKQIQKMVFYTFLDFSVGLIPFIGDIFDFAFKAHSKNMHILEEFSKTSNNPNTSLN